MKFLDTLPLLLMSPEDAGGGDGFSPGDPIDDSGGDDDEVIDTDDPDDFDEVIEEDSDDDSDKDDSDDGEDSDEDSEDDEDDTVDEEDKPRKVKAKKEVEKDEPEVDPADPSVNANIIREASKKYPKLFKEFPEIKAAFFYGRNVRTLFPTIEDAQSAAESVQNFEYIKQEVESGNPDNIVEFLKQDKKVLYKFARKMNDGIAKNDPQVYAMLTAPVITNVLKNMMREAKVHGNENMEKAAKWVSQYVFDSPNLPDDPGLPKDEPADSRVNELLSRQFTSFRQDVMSSARERLVNVVSSSVAKLKASTAVKRTIIKDTMAIISDTVGGDKSHVAYMDTLWHKAKRSGFTRQDASRINEAYLDAVKRVLPGAREKALKQNGFSVKKVAKAAKLKMTNKEDKSTTRKVAKSSTTGRKDTSTMTELQFLEHLEKEG